MPPLNYIDATEFCETSGSKVGWISMSDAENYAKDILAGNITGHQVEPPFLFWTGVFRIDDFYFQNDTQILELDGFPGAEFWATTISGNEYRDLRHGRYASMSPCSHGVVTLFRLGLDSQKDLNGKLTNRHANYVATCFCKVFDWRKVFQIRNDYKFFNFFATSESII